MSSVGPTLILAPIRGVTDVLYRNTFARCFGGLDRAVAPFIHLRRGHGLRPADRQQLAPEHNRELPVIPQVLAHSPALFAAVVRGLHDLGHGEVNWNLGCPQPTVAGRGRGAGLLPHPERIASILEQVLGQCPVRLSVKLRLGYRDPDEFLAVLDVLNRFPLSEVILHARTAAQLYGGTVDVERAARALELCRHPFVYNGDINTPQGFRDLCRRLPGAAGWMLGRGVLMCPFLPAQLRGTPLPSAEVRRERLRDFHAQLLDGYRQRLSGPAHLLNKMKEHWAYLAFSFAAPQEVLARIRQSRAPDAYHDAVARVFDQPLDGLGAGDR
ncbi:MAG: hypothetical protein A3K19_23315 [Lentisphaerae bacterium RIFOXYB12_FULL_65_16]|nr:MAG: hypothetical protein A3K18_20175 [Lentisphaerae bacterium RIFOXYA12_64_32]OGV87495.1 MAG: hypothetical protein A3K19_23315 [Lentisphaerae bacterium RIFOXYB12_FULL_65_16]